MVPIVAPVPRTPILPHSSFISSLLSTDIETTAPPLSMSPPRLMSPFQLAETPRYLKPMSTSRCNSSPVRRITLNQTARSAHHRRRNCPRPDCQFESLATDSPFDHLPWITALDSSRDYRDPQEIADLSQIIIPSAGAGPVRRRKTSLRSNPLACSVDSPSQQSPPRREQARPFPFLADRLSVGSPRTPTLNNSSSMSQVHHFHNLMPAFGSSCRNVVGSPSFHDAD